MLLERWLMLLAVVAAGDVRCCYQFTINPFNSNSYACSITSGCYSFSNSFSFK